MIIKIFKLMS